MIDLFDKIKPFFDNYSNIFISLSAVATTLMCYFSFVNAKTTKQQIIYKNKIISTKNWLYSAICHRRDYLIAEIRRRNNILQLFICLFLLKKDKDGKNFKCYYCFNKEKETPIKIQQKIWITMLEVGNNDDFKENYKIYKDLKEIIALYFGKEQCERKITINNQECTELDSILRDILHFGYVEQGGITEDLHNNTETEIKKVFQDYVSTYNNHLVHARFYGFNLLFKKFYISTYKSMIDYNKAYNQKNNSKKQIPLRNYNIEDFCFNFIDGHINLLIDDIKKKNMLEQYNLLNDNLRININDGIVAKISEDFDNEGFIYLNGVGFLKKCRLKSRQRSYFKKVKEQTKIDNYKEVHFPYKISSSMTIDVDFIKLEYQEEKTNKEQPLNTEDVDLTDVYWNV